MQQLSKGLWISLFIAVTCLWKDQENYQWGLVIIKKNPTDQTNNKKRCELEKYFGTEVFKTTKGRLESKSAAMF